MPDDYFAPDPNAAASGGAAPASPAVVESSHPSSGVPGDTLSTPPVQMEMALEIASLEEVTSGEEYSLNMVAELFSPGTLNSRASAFGLKEGPVFDLRNGWDLNDSMQVRKMWAVLEETQPLVILGSPRCAAFTKMQDMNNTDTERYKRLLHEGLQHLKICCAVYAWQRARGALFLHEHPEGAWSWKLGCVKSVSELEGVLVVRGDQCPYVQLVNKAGGDGVGLLKKSTCWMTNSAAIAAAVSMECRNPYLPPELRHEHLPLFGVGRAKASERYPPLLVKAILLAVKYEQQTRGILSLSAVDLNVGETVEEPEFDYSDLGQKLVAVEADPGVVYDQYTGLPLDRSRVVKARKEEIEYMHTLKVWEPRPYQECLTETNAKPLGTTRIECNKGDDVAPEVRSRLCVQETRFRTTIDPGDLAAVFSATPPLEALRFLLCLAMTLVMPAGVILVIRFLDISRAHPHSPVRRKIYVNPPAEAGFPAGTVALLLRTLYGLRDAGQNFEFTVYEIMTGMGFVCGVYSPCLFFHLARLIRVLVHGDDFVVLAGREEGLWFKDELGKHLIVKDRGVLGPDAAKGDKQQVSILNRLVRWMPAMSGQPDRIEY